ncbi:CgeB family protein [Rhizobium bangladeshense]|uniref:CgeB family protein n=1 Tax=Rhizobium bangladeshense TaxID=1138189 RepID=UPI0007E54559|nr:glycosyltransferase [Rhizobium bangladeshense]
MTRPLDIVFLGLALSSSWGNGHATTYRALIKGLRPDGHRVLFLERDVPWYADHRDLATPDFCELAYYSDLDAMIALYGERLRNADAVIVGSYVPQGVALIDKLEALGPNRLCFYDIDTPVTLAKLDRGDEEYVAKRQIPTFDAYFSFSGGEVLTRLEQNFGAQKAVALYCSVDQERYANTGEPPIWDLGYLGTYSPDRQPTLERLLLEPARRLPGMRFVVAGPQYPAEIDWPSNVERIEHLAPADHASFYSRQRFTLNVTRSDMISAGWSPSVRLFEAAACGTPVISDNWRGLDELLPDGEALIVARGADDVMLALMELSERERMAIAAAAKGRVLDGHTGAVRAGELVRILSNLPISPAYERISA